MCCDVLPCWMGQEVIRLNHWISSERDNEDNNQNNSESCQQPGLSRFAWHWWPSQVHGHSRNPGLLLSSHPRPQEAERSQRKTEPSIPRLTHAQLASSPPQSHVPCTRPASATLPMPSSPSSACQSPRTRRAFIGPAVARGVTCTSNASPLMTLTLTTSMTRST